MSEPKVEIVHDAKNVIFYPTPKRVTYLDNPESPLLKRLAPRRPPLNPVPPEIDDSATPETQD